MKHIATKQQELDVKKSKPHLVKHRLMNAKIKIWWFAMQMKRVQHLVVLDCEFNEFVIQFVVELRIS